MAARSPIHYRGKHQGRTSKQLRKFGMTDAQDIVSEYEVAALVAMSPDLPQHADQIDQRDYR